MTKAKSFLLIFTVIALVIAPSFSVFAQDDDLSLPGDETPVVNTTPATTDVDGLSSETGKQSVVDLILAGGWAMYPLFLMLFVVVALFVFLLLDLKKSSFSPPVLVEGMTTSAQAGDLNGISELARNSSSCLGQVMNGACEYIYDRGYQVLDGDSILDQMADASQEFNRKRVGLLNYISVISQAAPMVGLLGTVSGMIKAFQTLNSKGNSDQGALAGHISEALVTTAGGLVVALPAIFAFFFLRNRIVGLVADVDKQCARVLTLLRRAVVGSPGGNQAPPPQQQQPPQQPHPLA